MLHEICYVGGQFKATATFEALPAGERSPGKGPLQQILQDDLCQIYVYIQDDNLRICVVRTDHGKDETCIIM